MLARYRRAAGIIVDSHFSRAELLDVVPVDPALISVVYPGVADDVMHVRRARDDDAPFILCVGTVEARKNLEILVRALPALPRLRLISVGPPTPYRDVCLRIAHDLGVANRFDLRGYVARAALLDLYARALVAAVPSRYEGFGYAAAQALCAGTPLVTSNAASLPEVAPPGSVLLPPDDAGAWAAAIGAVASARDQADARAAALRASACERFAWSSAAKRAHEAYAAALLRQ
jgi:glycosyltransferase involved in cell wall biosynthesis